MNFELNGKKYVCEPLTLGQMELITEYLESERSEILDSKIKETDGLKSIAKIAIKTTDIFRNMIKAGRLKRFAAICVKEENQKFDRNKVDQIEKEFEDLPFNIAEDIFSFFYYSEAGQSWIFPRFLTAQTPVPEQQA
jgi:hypothetical protein